MRVSEGREEANCEGVKLMTQSSVQCQVRTFTFTACQQARERKKLGHASGAGSRTRNKHVVQVEAVGQAVWCGADVIWVLSAEFAVPVDGTH